MIEYIYLYLLAQQKNIFLSELLAHFIVVLMLWNIKKQH